MIPVSFQIIDWSGVDTITHPGESGLVHSKTVQFKGLRIRMIEYGPGYLADHWCTKGHVVHCLEGELISEMKNGDQFILTQGMSYIVSDELSIHRSKTREGAKLMIVDGDFLNH